MDLGTLLHSSTAILLTGLPIVVLLTAAGFGLALVAGIVGGTLATHAGLGGRIVVGAYVYVFRSMPFLMFVFIAYYGLPYYGVNIGPVTTAIVALTLSHGAYLTEIVRGGLSGFERGQNEAAIALGFSFARRMVDIVLPQVFMAIAPSLVGQAILIVKDTSIVSIIGISELTRLGREIVVRTNEPFVVFSLVALAYFLLCFGLQRTAGLIERRSRRRIFGR